MWVILRPATDADRDPALALGVTEETVWFGAAELSAEEVGESVDDESGLLPGVVADELLPWLLEQRDLVELMTFAGDAARVAAFERHGLRHRRSSFSLARRDSAGPPAGAALPDGIEVVPYRLGDDDAGVHRLIYVDAAWASAFLARRDGRPVGWVAGRLLDSGRGWVDTLAVASGERRRGLGRALLLHAFGDLQRAGARGISLGVEAENEAALGLYRSVGLEVEREWRIYAIRGASRTVSGQPSGKAR